MNPPNPSPSISSFRNLGLVFPKIPKFQAHRRAATARDDERLRGRTSNDEKLEKYRFHAHLIREVEIQNLLRPHVRRPWGGLQVFKKLKIFDELRPATRCHEKKVIHWDVKLENFLPDVEVVQVLSISEGSDMSKWRKMMADIHYLVNLYLSRVDSVLRCNMVDGMVDFRKNVATKTNL